MNVLNGVPDLVLGGLLEGLLVWLAIWDVQFREAPNGVVLPLLGVTWAGRLFIGAPEGWGVYLLLAALLLAGYALGWMGGGDLKGLLALLAIGPTLLAFALLGAMLVGAGWMLWRREPSAPGYAGFALGVGGWWVLAWLRLAAGA